MPKKRAHEAYERKENKNESNNECEELSCDNEKEDDEDYHAMLKDKKSSNVTKNNMKCKCKVIA